MIRFGALLLLAMILLGATPRPALAAESYDNCTGFITSLPAVISNQGTWCLKQDLSTAITTGNAIQINNSNVTIDCNGFRIDGIDAGDGTQTLGIFAGGRFNIAVRHCDVRGFFTGLVLIGSVGGGHVVEDNRFIRSTRAGMQVDGDGSVIRRNLVLSTGYSTHVTDALGIITTYSVDVINNNIVGVYPTTFFSDSNVHGILVNDNDSSQISGNRIHELHPAGAGIALAINVQNSNGITLRGNDVVGDGSPGSIGLSCLHSLDRARDNEIGNFATGIQSCANVSGNDIY